MITEAADLGAPFLTRPRGGTDGKSMVDRKKLGEILVQAGAITPKQLKEALEDQRRYGGRLGDILLDRRYIDERSFLVALSQQLKIPAIDFAKSTIPEAVIHIVSQEIQEKSLVFPIGIKHAAGGNVLILSMADPTDVEIQDRIRFLTGHRVEPVLALESVIREAIREYWYRQEGKGSYRYTAPANISEVEHNVKEPPIEDRIAGERVIDFDEDTRGPRAANTIMAEPESGPIKAKPSRELLALLRLLAKKGVITEEEFLEELKKTR